MLLASCNRGGISANEPQVLHVADQLKTLQPLLAAAGEDKPTSYRIEWSTFFTGPSVISAITGGSVDAGWMAETPLVFAQAAGSPVKVVAASRRAAPGTSVIALVVQPGSSIHSIADLKGKAIGWMPGTLAQYLVIRLLEANGLSTADIKPVVMTSGGPAMLKSGTVDALVTADPYLSQMIDAHQARILATGGEPITPELQYIVAGNAVLSDAKQSKILGDFVGRVARTIRWQREHPIEAAQVAAKVYGVSPTIGAMIASRAPGRYVPIDQGIVAAQQQEADIFQRIGLIRKPIDAAKLFDHRYDSVVAQAEAAR
ncbi:MAG: transporter substrate-binding protein [Sphingomonadales bacterium]|nr:transporter substrate-binding protein [Sphingomonadales bacterium]